MGCPADQIFHHQIVATGDGSRRKIQHINRDGTARAGLAGGGKLRGQKAEREVVAKESVERGVGWNIYQPDMVSDQILKAKFRELVRGGIGVDRLLRGQLHD